MEKNKILVTVGTTCFPDLTASVVNNLDELIEMGYSVLIQCGTEKLETEKATVVNFCNLAEAMQNASVIISHGGSGCVLEAMRIRPPKKVIVCANETLMDNHQLELCMELQDYVHVVKPNEIMIALKSKEEKKLFPLFNPLVFKSFVEKLD